MTKVSSLDGFMADFEYGQFRAQWAADHRYRKKRTQEYFFLNDEIYHYTDMAGLQGILEGRGFWLSEAKFLNDSEELYNGLNLTKSLIVRLLKKDRYKSFYKVLEMTLTHLEKNKFQNNYIASFSLKADDLEQWRAYAKNGSGVCIGFNVREKTTYPHFPISNIWRLSRVIYNDKLKLWILHSIIFKYFYEFKQDIRSGLTYLYEEEYALFLANSLSRVFIRFKNEAFESEKEVRLIYDMDDPLELFNKKCYRNVNNVLVPYVCTNDTKLKNSDGIKLEIDLLPLSKIIVGPTINQDVIIESIQNFIEDIGYSDITVKSSKVPYRG